MQGKGTASRNPVWDYSRPHSDVELWASLQQAHKIIFKVLLFCFGSKVDGVLRGVSLKLCKGKGKQPLT